MKIFLCTIASLLLISIGNTEDFSKYKTICSDIGFTPDTDLFSECVLRLIKKDRAKIKAQVELEKRRIEEERIENNKKQEIQKQAEYEKERLRIEKERLQIEKDRDKREAEEKEALAEAIRKENLRIMIDRIFTPPSRNSKLNCSPYPNADGTTNCYYE